MDHNGRPLVVSAVVADGSVGSFGLGVAAEVFGYDRRALGLPRFDFALVGPRPGVLRTDTGMAVVVEHGLDRLAVSDVVLLTAWELYSADPPPEMLAALRAAHARGALVVSQCTGAFVLAAAGLLDGRPATTHWVHSSAFRRLFPSVLLDPDVLFVDDGDVLTSAGNAAGIDLLLHVVRRDHGSEVASRVARRSVVAPWREGGQSQFIERPVPAPGDSGTAATRAWALERLGDPLGLADLAAHANMSVRSFTRRFREETGSSAGRWLVQQRVALARRLLESTDIPVERVAVEAGFGTTASMRQHLHAAIGVAPLAYRRTYRGALPHPM